MTSILVESKPLNSQTPDLKLLRSVFGDRVQEGVHLAKYTSARIGGPADLLIISNSAEDLANLVKRLWDMDLKFIIIGGGSNILVSDAGVREIVILNHAREIEFEMDETSPSVWAESGANLGSIARQAAVRGLSGLEWAVGIPGTVGGAITGNAGAHGSEISANLLMAEILHHESGIGRSNQREIWSPEKLLFEYRSSKIKSEPGSMIVLSARLQLQHSTRDTVQKRTDEFTAYRHRTQPPGASMGSMFKNPPGDYAGRLIDAAGLKGTRVGGAEISSLHGNFFINNEEATAKDVLELIELARERVKEEFNVDLNLEIELVGDW